MKTLLIGFAPFADYDVNPSQQLVEALTSSTDANLYGRIYPVQQEGLRARLHRDLQELRPQRVIALGLAAGIPAIQLERIAVNLADFRIPDAQGKQPQAQPVKQGGPQAYFSTLPLQAWQHTLLQQGIPARLSNSAGTYLCNLLMYEILDHQAAQGFPQQGGFVHLPLTCAMVTQRAQEGLFTSLQPSLPLSFMARGIRSLLTLPLSS